MTRHIVIEFDAEDNSERGWSEQWWVDLKRLVTNALAAVTSPQNLSFVHSSGNKAQDEELMKAEQAANTLAEILTLLKSVDPDRRTKIIKVLSHTGND